MLKRRLRIVKIGDHYEIEKRRCFRWVCGSWRGDKHDEFDSLEQAEKMAYRLYDFEIVKEL